MPRVDPVSRIMILSKKVSENGNKFNIIDFKMYSNLFAENTCQINRGSAELVIVLGGSAYPLNARVDD